MVPPADIALFDSSGQLRTLVEIKKKLGTSREWAAKLRRNLLAHGSFGSVEFFLIVTPDRLYVWKDAGGEPIPIEPTYEIDAHSILEPYASRAGLDPATVSNPAFELIVTSWLADLIRSASAAEKPAGEQSWLRDSGFLGAVRNGRVEYEVAA
jgi:hypothetical protein